LFKNCFLSSSKDGTWGVVSVVSGELEVVHFERRDDGLIANHAELIPVLTTTSPSGSLESILPPWNEYHSIENKTDRIAVTIDTYGKEPKHFHQYDMKDSSVNDAELEYDFVYDQKNIK
jgi:tellurite resistance-related uncharacterized protein